MNYLKRLPETWCYKASDAWISGIPDVIGVQRGTFFSIELKSAKGKVSPIQHFVLKQISKAGGRTLVARSLDEVKMFMEGR